MNLELATENRSPRCWCWGPRRDTGSILGERVGKWGAAWVCKMPLEQHSSLSYTIKTTTDMKAAKTCIMTGDLTSRQDSKSVPQSIFILC